MLSYFAGKLHTGEEAFGQFLGWNNRTIGIITGIEYVIAKAIFLDAKTNNLYRDNPAAPDQNSPPNVPAPEDMESRVFQLFQNRL